MTQPTNPAWLSATTARDEQLRFLHDTTLPELRRSIDHERAGKARWRARAEQAEAALVTARAGATERADLLEHARDLLEPWGGHGGAWPDIAPAIERLVTEHREAELRAAAGTPLICCDERHAAKVTALETRIAAVRTLHHDDFGLCSACTGSHGVPSPCPTMAALDGPADTPAAFTLPQFGPTGAMLTQPTTTTLPALADLYATIAAQARTDAAHHEAKIAASLAASYTVVRTDPVEQVAAETTTVARLKAEFAAAPEDQYPANWGPLTLQGSYGAFLPVVTDDTLPVDEVHLRPHPRPAEPKPGPNCCICGTTEHGGGAFYENYRGRLFCWSCADGRQPACPLGGQCDGVDCPRRAEHGPRPSKQPPAGWCPTCEGQPRTAS